MDEHDICFDDECPNSEHNRLLRIAVWAADHNLLGPDDEPRKILGQVSVTADGAIVGHHLSTVYYIDHWGKPRPSSLYHRGSAKLCYSTREAAERAAKGGGDGQ